MPERAVARAETRPRTGLLVLVPALWFRTCCWPAGVESSGSPSTGRKLGVVGKRIVELLAGGAADAADWFFSDRMGEALETNERSQLLMGPARGILLWAALAPDRLLAGTREDSRV